MLLWYVKKYSDSEIFYLGEFMTEQEIINETNKVFEESFEIESERLVPEANIFIDLGLDSLDIVDLIVALQSSFGVKIRNEEKVRDIRTLQDLYQFISAIKSVESEKIG
jgi:acyl carrier protein